MLRAEKKENVNYIIYRHTTPSGKVYIGQTCKRPNIRWLNGNGYKNLNKISADCIEIDLIYYYKKDRIIIKYY